MHFYKKPQIVISVAIIRVQRPKNDCFICVNSLFARLRKLSRRAKIQPVRQKTNCKTQTTIFAKSTVSGLQVPSPSGTRVAKTPHIACRDSFRKPGPSYPALFFSLRTCKNSFSAWAGVRFEGFCPFLFRHRNAGPGRFCGIAPASCRISAAIFAR